MERLLRAIDQSLSQLNRRLTELENRLGGAEHERNVVIEECRVPDRVGELGEDEDGS
jgi:hypothetical protein